MDDLCERKDGRQAAEISDSLPELNSFESHGNQTDSEEEEPRSTSQTRKEAKDERRNIITEILLQRDND